MTDNALTSAKSEAAAASAAVPRAKFKLAKGHITALSVIVVLSLWELAGPGMNPLFGSYPSAIWKAGVRMAQSGDLGTALFSSLQPFAAGYLLAMLAGVPLGLLIGRYRTVEAALGIYITAGYAMPLVALVPLFMLWFGLGFTVKVAIIFTLSIFPICINTWEGVRAVPKTQIEVGTSFVASPAAIMWKIVLPATLPYIVAGLKLAIGKAVIAMVVAEFFTAISGLGGIIINAANQFDTAAMFVPIIILMVLAVGLTALVGWLERRIAPWQTEISGREAA
jgi:NitT/TauT family transport system permease protein